ncbi:MAG: nitrite/sulfite reductase [Candidatus Bathyarchaeia archaeon]
MKVSTASIERFIGRYSIGRDSNPSDVTGSIHFLRVKIPGGFITSDQFRRVAEISAKYARSQAEITNRQDIQLHWIEAEDALDIFTVLDELGFTTDMCGQGFAGARYGDVRNIVCCPVSGIEKGEILDVRPSIRKLTNFFVGNTDFLDMPRKFKISISGCGADCTRAETNDLALAAVRKGDESGFTLLVGGSVGSSLPGPRLAQPTGIFVKPEDALDFVVASAEIHRDYGNRESKAKARFKWLIDDWGIEKFLAVLEEKLGKPLERYDGPIFLRDSDHEGVQPQSQEGYYYVNIPLLGGGLNSQDMVRIADLAEKYGSGELRLTPTQNIIVPNVVETKNLIKHLEKMNFILNNSRLRWTSMACSSDFCGKTQSPHSKELLNEIVMYLETKFDKRLLDEAKVRIHISGCPNNCCANNISDIGLGGKLLREGDQTKQAYDIFLGGRFGLEQRFGRLAEEKVPAQEIKNKLDALMSNYLKKRANGESLGEFCNRHTTEELKMYLDINGG